MPSEVGHLRRTWSAATRSSRQVRTRGSPFFRCLPRSWHSPRARYRTVVGTKIAADIPSHPSRRDPPKMIAHSEP
jgi:hypothetical protein